MKQVKFDSEERDRAKRLNDSIGTVTMLNNDCIAMMKAYFSDVRHLFGYLHFKEDYSRNHETHETFGRLLSSLKDFHKAMLANYWMLKSLESEFHEYSRSMQWMMRHMERATHREEKAEVFAEMEAKTEKMLSIILPVKKEIDMYIDVFAQLYKCVTLPEMN